MPDSDPIRRQDYDRWRGEMEARVRNLEDGFRERDKEAHDMSKDLVSIRLDMRAMLTELESVGAVVRSREEAADKEREDFISELKNEMRSGKASRLQIMVAVAAPIIAGILVYLIIAALTGQFTTPHH